jgi:threonine dehydrogenase-like Zn-dependent dehydrogenase
MHSLVFNKDGGLTFQTDYPIPSYALDEALVRITLAGICNTDLEILKGYMGFEGIPGHEFVGTVEKCRDNDLMGRRVAGEINIGCNNCSYCSRQMQNHCPDRSVAGILKKDGVFGEYVVFPIKNLHLIPDEVSDKEAVFVEPLAAAFEIINQVSISPDDRVCVLGDGKMGLLVGQVMSLTGCSLIVSGKHANKLSILDNKGIKTCFCSDLDEKDFDVVIDCTGSSEGIGAALEITRPGGKIIVKTTTSKEREMSLNHIVINELSIVGSRCGPFPVAIKALQEKRIDVLPLISKIYPLREGVKAFDYAAGGDVIKVILSKQ